MGHWKRQSDWLLKLQEGRKRRHKKHRIIIHSSERRTKKPSDVFKNVLFFDGTDIESVRILFTPMGRLKRVENVIPPKPIGLKTIKVIEKVMFIPPPLPKPYKKPIEVVSPPITKPEIKREIRRMPTLPEHEPKKEFTRPPAVYQNHSNPRYPVYNELAKERIKKTG